ncbi:TonB family protein [Bacteroidota bacterium]
MLFRFLLIAIILMPVKGSSQVLDTMYFDNNWEQTKRTEAHYYRIISVDTSGDFRLYVTDYYPGGQIQMTGTYKSIRPDNKDGHFIYRFEDGKKQMECYYHNNSLHGLLREWYDSGQPESSQEYANGMLEGDYTSWREDGSLKLQARYHKGEKHGNFQSYFPNGQMTRNDYYENGKLVEGQCYSSSGEPVDYFPYILMPRFRDGRRAMQEFIDKEIKYPQEALRRGIEGTVIILFTVDEEGFVKDPRVVNGDRKSFNKEALRLVEQFPRWIPGEVDGIPAPIQVSIPVEFRLR